MICKDIDLKSFNSFKTKANAKLFAEVFSVDELISVLRETKNEEKLVLGGGNNLFFTKNFDGIVLKPGMRGLQIINQSADYIDIRVGAGEDWDKFVCYCVDNNYSGVENLSLIPGNVGAAPIQNIGAYGVEAKDTILQVETIDMNTCEPKIFESKDCKFQYRNSFFKQNRNYIVLAVSFRLNKNFSYVERYSHLNDLLANKPKPSLADVRQAVISARRSKLPDEKLLANAGSFFQNPIITEDKARELKTQFADIPLFETENGFYKTSAAFIIEKSGLKGYRRNNVGIYDKHALIIVNYGSENGLEIVHFKDEICEKVNKQFGILLVPEVQIY